MHNLSDEELDRLSREAAEVNQTPVSPAGWDIISSRLDKDMPVPYVDKTWYLRVITDLLLLLTLTYLGTQYPSVPSKQNAIQIQEGKVAASLAAAEPTTASEGINQGAGNAPVRQNQNDADETIAQNTNGEKRSTTSTGESNHTSHSKKEADVKLDKTPVKPDNRLNQSADNKTSMDLSKGKSNVVDLNVAIGDKESTNVTRGNPYITNEKKQTSDNNLPIGSNNQKQNPAKTDYDQPSGDKPISAKNQVIDSTDKAEKPSIKTDENAALSQAGAKDKKKKSKANNLDGITKNALQIGLTWSPDFSRVGNTKSVKNGHTMGITAGYQINRRWSIQTAFLYTNKYYTTGNSYGKIPGYSPADPYVKIKQVNAECFMWDIPLNVRFDWLVKSKSRAFVSTGFSSYFMKKEDLHYWYTHYNNPKYKHWINEANSNYWFAIGNISAGFEQFITPSISVQVEPFFKFPLRELGYGQINLKSSGIFLGVKYTPPLHLSKK